MQKLIAIFLILPLFGFSQNKWKIKRRFIDSLCKAEGFTPVTKSDNLGISKQDKKALTFIALKLLRPGETPESFSNYCVKDGEHLKLAGRRYYELIGKPKGKTISITLFGPGGAKCASGYNPITDNETGIPASN